MTSCHTFTKCFNIFLLAIKSLHKFLSIFDISEQLNLSSLIFSKFVIIIKYVFLFSIINLCMLVNHQCDCTALVNDTVQTKISSLTCLYVFFNDSVSFSIWFPIITSKSTVYNYVHDHCLYMLFNKTIDNALLSFSLFALYNNVEISSI